MSDTILTLLPYTVDLAEPIKKTYLDMLFATEDNEAHRFNINLLRSKAKVALPSGTAINAYFIRYSDNATISLGGTAAGNVASVTLKSACYNKGGQFALVIKAVIGDVTNTVFYGEGNMFVSVTDTILDEENVVPSLSDLLAQIDAMEAGTQAANEAADRANATSAKFNGLTVSAEDGGKAEATVTEKNGVKHIHFKLPQGPIGPQGLPGRDGTGTGTVTSVNGIEPDDWGNVQLGEGMYAFHIDENGHLICTYDTATAPPLSINDDGHLIYTVSGQTIDLGKVVG